MKFVKLTFSIPSVDFPVPYITPEQPAPVLFDGAINLTCFSYGSGPFTLTWKKGEMTFDSRDSVNSLSLVVNITSLQDYAVYTCTAQNEAGNNSASVTVLQQGLCEGGGGGWRCAYVSCQ